VWRRCDAKASKVRGWLACRCRSEMKSMLRHRSGAWYSQNTGSFASGPALRADTLPAPLQLTTVARSITTSSSGTSSWNPRLPVRVFSIASITSLPETTLPNTA